MNACWTKEHTREAILQDCEQGPMPVVSGPAHHITEASSLSFSRADTTSQAPMPYNPNAVDKYGSQTASGLSCIQIP